MSQSNVKALLSAAISSVANKIGNYSVSPGHDFTRNRCLPPEMLLSFLLTEGSSSTKNELFDFYGPSQKVSASALNQQRGKLKHEALYAVLSEFNRSLPTSDSKYHYIAADGSTATYFSTPKFSDDDYYYSPGPSVKGAYSMHVNAFYDLISHRYTDVVIQPVHQKDEYKAFCTIVDRHPVTNNTKNIYMGDRGYCSYNNMAHVIESGQYFLFRAKDVSSKGIVSGFGISPDKPYDGWVSTTLTRTHNRNVFDAKTCRFICKNISFDYIEQDSYQTYPISFRIVRFELSTSSYECILTNLPEDEFPPDKIKELYNLRWGIESSFRQLKYTVGLSNFHSYKPEFIKQEILAKIILYNATEAIIQCVAVQHSETTKHGYKVNFAYAVHICRIFLRYTTKEGSMDVSTIISKELVPIRNNRKYPRLQTAHFRRPRYFIYRAS